MHRLRRYRPLLFILASTPLAGVLAYTTLAFMRMFEKRTISITQGLLFVVETMTTTGYGELLPFRSWQMTFYALFLMLLGIGLIFVFLSTLASEWVRTRFEPLPPREAPPGMKKHVLICNYNTQVEVLLEALRATYVPVLVVDASREVVADLTNHRVAAVLGDPTNSETLLAAGIRDARWVVAAANDGINANTVLAAKSLAHVPVIATIEDLHHLAAMNYAGADYVVAPKKVLGEEMVRWAVSSIPYTLPNSAQNSSELQLVELPVFPESPLAGQTLADLRLSKQTGATVIGYWHHGVFRLADTSTEIPESSVLTALGSEQHLNQLARMVVSHAQGLRTGQGPTVIAGYGDVGRAVAERLAAKGCSCTVLDKRHLDVSDSVAGDATSETGLMLAGVDKAGTLIVALDKDVEAIFTTLIARKLNPHVRIIARCYSKNTVSKLYRSGADAVLSLSEFATALLTNLISGGQKLEYQDFGVQFFAWLVTAKLNGVTLAASKIAVTGCVVVAVQNHEMVTAAPEPETTLVSGSTLVLLGTDESIKRFRTDFG